MAGAKSQEALIYEAYRAAMAPADLKPFPENDWQGWFACWSAVSNDDQTFHTRTDEAIDYLKKAIVFHLKFLQKGLELEEARRKLFPASALLSATASGLPRLAVTAPKADLCAVQPDNQASNQTGAPKAAASREASDADLGPTPTSQAAAAAALLDISLGGSSQSARVQPQPTGNLVPVGTGETKTASAPALPISGASSGGHKRTSPVGKTPSQRSGPMEASDRGTAMASPQATSRQTISPRSKEDEPKRTPSRRASHPTAVTSKGTPPTLPTSGEKKRKSDGGPGGTTPAWKTSKSSGPSAKGAAEEDVTYIVRTILGKRRRPKGKGANAWMYLVAWDGYPSSENSWEPYAHVKHMPDLLANAKEM